jgi:TonB family protein
MACLPFARQWQPVVLVLSVLPVIGGNTLLLRSSDVAAWTKQETQCGVLPALERLPPLDAVVDSAAFGAKLVAASRLVRPGEILMALHFDADGQLVNTILLETDFAADTADMYAAVAASLARRRALGEFHGLRLRVHTRDPVSVTLEHSEYCAPQEHPVMSSRQLREVINDQELPAITTSGRWTIRVRVGANGKVLETRLVESSGSRVIDDLMLRDAESLRFRPATLDGLPVAVWHELSTRIKNPDQ